MKSVELDNCDIITNTESVSIKSECENTGNVKRWTKRCPQCNGEQYYKQRNDLLFAIRKNKICRRCRGNNDKILPPDGGWTKKCPVCNKEQVYTKKYTRDKAEKENKSCPECIRKQKYPVPVGGWTKKCPECGKELKYTNRDHYNYSIKNKCVCKICSNKLNPRRGGKGLPKDYVMTDEHRKKLRLNRIKYLQSCYGNQLSPTYNKTACKYFDDLNANNKWNGQHAMNGGEYYVNGLGYWVDYYEPTLNIVVEYDEPWHYRKGKLLEKDIYRMEKIKDHLKCKFFRYNQKLNELKEW